MSSSSDHYFLLYACCIPVSGARRATICDVQRGAVHPVPNTLLQVIERCRLEPVDDVMASLAASDRAVAEEYLAFLTKHELGFLTTEPSRFPLLSLAWDHPSRITNAVVDVDSSTGLDWIRVVRELDLLGVKALQVRFFGDAAETAIEAALVALDETRIRHVEILAPHSSRLGADAEQFLPVRFQRLGIVRYYGAPANARRVNLNTGAIFIEQQGTLSADVCCSGDAFGDFVINCDLFTEAQAHHACLNRKLHIAADLSLRNCPSTRRTFGRLGDRPLQEVVDSAEFQRLWRINRERISGCSECEFRFVCVTSDCAALEAAYPGPYAKPAMCGYDPYQAAHSPK